VYDFAVTGKPGTHLEQGLVEEALRLKKRLTDLKGLEEPLGSVV
jgi:hypothetical protein